MKPSILTIDGHYFNFLNPDPKTITIENIAHALSNTCRFHGHCKKFYSVAQHSVHVSHLVPSEDALIGLLHDAAEAYLGDIATPLKILLPEYKKIEKRIEKIILKHFGLSKTLPASVKHADLIMLATEKRDIMPNDNDGTLWSIINEIEPTTDLYIEPLSPLYAYRLFMDRYELLK